MEVDYKVHTGVTFKLFWLLLSSFMQDVILLFGFSSFCQMFSTSSQWGGGAGELTWALDWWEKGRAASNVSPTVPALVGQSWVFEITTRWLISISVGLCETPTVVKLLFKSPSSISSANIEIMCWVWPILFYCKYLGNFWQSSSFTL